MQVSLLIILSSSVVLANDGHLRHGGDKCQVSYNVWHPNTDMVQRMQILEMKYANFSTYVDVELLRIRLNLQTDLFQLNNITSDLGRDILSRKLENAKMMSELAGINRRIEDYEKTLDILGERVNTVVLQKSVRRSVRRKHSRADRTLAVKNPIVIEVLSSKVADLKAEWILMKRELIELKQAMKQLQSDHKGLLNSSGQFRTPENRQRSDTQSGRQSGPGTSSLQVSIDRLKFDVTGMQKKQDGIERDVSAVESNVNLLSSSVAEVRQKLKELHPGSSGMTSPKTAHLPMADRHYQHTGIPKDCQDIVISGYRTSGVYKTKPSTNRPLDDVYCEIVGDVGYTVLQRRTDGLQSFNRGWLEYKVGFGNLYGEYWSGNDFIHSMTRDNGYILRVDLWDWEGNQTYAEFDTFSVLDEKNKFAVSVGGYRGTAGDSLTYHNGMAFSTPDRDNDQHKRNCAADNKGGWWYKSCYVSQLNGIYHVGWYSQPESTFADGVVWVTVKNSERYSVRRAEMKLRRKM